MRALIAVALLVLSSSAVAGESYGGHLSDADISSIHSIAVVSAVGKTLYVRRVGFTAFQNKLEEVPIADWALDEKVASQVEKVLNSNYVVEKTVVAPEAYPADSPDTALGRTVYQSLVEQGRKQGADMVLVIARAPTLDSLHIPEGMGLVGERLLTKERVYVVTAVALTAYRVSDGKRVATRNLYQLTELKIPWPIKTVWNDLSQEEKASLTDTIESALLDGVHSALSGIGLLKVSGK